MAAGSAAQILRVPGRMVGGPTNMGLDYPFGGVELGRVKGVSVAPQGEHFTVMSEGLGSPSDVLEGPLDWNVSFMLRGWDDDAVLSFFLDNASYGSATGHTGLVIPGSQVPGSSTLGRAVRVLYVPDEPIAAPALMVYRGISDWSPGAELAFQRQQELALPVRLRCMRDNFGRMLAIRRIADMVL